jgi:hypothetical protein
MDLKNLKGLEEILEVCAMYYVKGWEDCVTVMAMTKPTKEEMLQKITEQLTKTKTNIIPFDKGTLN